MWLISNAEVHVQLAGDFGTLLSRADNFQVSFYFVIAG
jgi:hypothetical protein